MFAKLASVAALLLAGCAPVRDVADPENSVADARAQGQQLSTACEGRDGWGDAAPPARIFGNTYYVGTCGIAVILITSNQGHVLIDASIAEAAPAIIANVRALGFDPRDIDAIIGSHEHLDHMGGFAALKAATGADIWASAAARTVLESGAVDAADPQFGIIPGMTPVMVNHVVSDGQTISVGPLAITAHLTPGHTSGGTSWSWRSCEGPNCATIAYVDSMSAVSRDDYRFTDHPERVAPYRATFDRVSRMPCDILVTPHPGFSNLFDRLRGAEPLIDRDACRRLVGTMRSRLDARLAREARP